ncbi:MAG TPA: hypothetical protein VJT09_17020 [Pyrinomonadaceae bacterium]|nr:hypothetical protein [Pyrinomonadaceae bacterium]
MKFKLLLLLLALLLFPSSSLGQQRAQGVEVPEGWKKINAEGLFTFYLPPGAWDTGLSGTDEYYREWRIGKVRFMFVYEPMSLPAYDSLDKVLGPGYQESIVEVGGRRAYLFHSSQIEKGRKLYYTNLFVGDLPKARVKLWMQLGGAHTDELKVAEQIFRTVEFLKP